MRNVGRYTQMVKVSALIQDMQRSAEYILNWHLTSEDYAFKDVMNEVQGRLNVLLGYASQIIKDEYDFGTDGHMLPYTIESSVEKVLKKHGLISDARSVPGADT